MPGGAMPGGAMPGGAMPGGAIPIGGGGAPYPPLEARVGAIAAQGDTGMGSLPPPENADGPTGAYPPTGAGAGAGAGGTG
jgi:hypothetical protein